jgi:hypothetical protein
MTLSELCLKGISLLSYLCGIWLTSVQKRSNKKRGDYKVFKTKHDTHWDKVDIQREWCRGGDLNGLRDMWALPVSGGWNHPVMS